MPILHGTPLSPYARKVLIAAAEKNLSFEHRPVTHFDLPEGFEKLHPLRKIPVWTTDDGEHIADSSVILAYLDKVAPKPRLIPEEPLPFAKALFLEEFADTALAPAIATIFLEKFAAPLFMGRPTDDKLVTKLLTKELPPLFAYVDESLGEREFLVGSEFSVADIAVASPLANLRHTGIAIDVGTYPNLRRFADRMITRPSIARLFAAEVADYGGESPEAISA